MDLDLTDLTHVEKKFKVFFELPKCTLLLRNVVAKSHDVLFLPGFFCVQYAH